MVYCPNCGTKNDDDAQVCKNCGASLRGPSRAYRRREYDDCFGIRRGAQIWTVIFGIFILLIGLTSLLGDYYFWLRWDRIWPLFIIVIGILIIYGAVSRR